jgi:hypothetical protein
MAEVKARLPPQANASQSQRVPGRKAPLGGEPDGEAVGDEHAAEGGAVVGDEGDQALVGVVELGCCRAHEFEVGGDEAPRHTFASFHGPLLNLSSQPRSLTAGNNSVSREPY